MERNRTLITAVVTAALVSVSPVHADDSTLSVSIHKLVGDGRSVAPVTITGGPPARAGELGRAPELASISCAGAAALAATWKQSAAVLAPAVTSATTQLVVDDLLGALIALDALAREHLHVDHGAVDAGRNP